MNQTIQNDEQYTLDWPTYAIDWAQGIPGYILLGSFTENEINQIEVITIQSNMIQGIRPVGRVKLDYPATQVQWKPTTTSTQLRNVFANTGDALRIWKIKDNEIITLAVFKQTRYSDITAAPTTSLDWNPVNHEIIVTGSVDTTCVIWDIERQTAQAQLIAHDREVFDVAFLAQSADIFVSSGAEGSLRMFDLRSLEHSTILYEASLYDTKSDELLPLLRVSANTQNQYILATFHLDSNIVHLIDIRFPGTPVLNLIGHDGNINCVQWAPGSRHICATGGDNGQILIWNTATNNALLGPDTASYGNIKNNICKQLNESVFFWNTNAEINNLCWSDDAKWIGVCWGTNFQALKI
ncbi:hypothetical protein PCANB_000817 [Pneumocystis canis]|nr:hypothetical protein PCANB_000817 [Pneumocystis canis]